MQVLSLTEVKQAFDAALGSLQQRGSVVIRDRDEDVAARRDSGR
jgi:hypothetical protein